MSARDATKFDAKLGARIRALRAEQGITQTELAEKLGVTFQQVQKYEKGINRMSVERLRDTAKVFGVSFADMLEEETPEAPSGSLIRRVSNAFALMPSVAAENWVASLEAVARGSSGKRRK